MHRFSAAYLERTRAGMWSDSRRALAGLDLPNRRRVLEVGCGSGELTRVLRAESPATVLPVDVDAALLAHCDDPRCLADARRLPVRADAVDLVVCQALLVNLTDPAAAVAEFARASSALVATIEPDNAAVSVDSTVEAEAALESRARAAFLAGVETDASMGADAAALLEEAGLAVRERTRYDHERVVEPPYDEADLADARRKATGAGLEASRGALEGALPAEAVDRLRTDWRAMGRAVVEAMAAGTYRRREVVPFHVTVAGVP